MNILGLSVKAFGVNNIRNDSGVLDPQWACYLDGIAIATDPSIQSPENSWLYCHSYAMPDGPHTITVNATVGNNQTFWFDRIEYAPSSSVSLANKTILVKNTDSAMQFSNGWDDYLGIGNWTQTQNAIFATNFYGMY